MALPQGRATLMRTADGMATLPPNQPTPAAMLPGLPTRDVRRASVAEAGEPFMFVSLRSTYAYLLLGGRDLELRAAPPLVRKTQLDMRLPSS